jgi:hypothetical protein
MKAISMNPTDQDYVNGLATKGARVCPSSSSTASLNLPFLLSVFHFLDSSTQPISPNKPLQPFLQMGRGYTDIVEEIGSQVTQNLQSVIEPAVSPTAVTKAAMKMALLQIILRRRGIPQ